MARLRHRPFVLACAIVCGMACACWGAPRASAESDAAGAGQEMRLPEKDRKLIWEIEHRGNILQKRGLQPMVDAIAASNGAALLASFADGIDARIPVTMRPTASRGGEIGTTARYDFEAASLKAADGPALVAHLLSYRAMFLGPPKSKVKLKRIAPVAAGELDGEWNAFVQFRLWGTSIDEGPLELMLYFDLKTARLSEETVVGRPYIRSFAMKRLKISRAPSFWMVETSRQSNIQVDDLHDNWKGELKVPISGGVYVNDYNQDGLVDLFVTDPALLYGFALYQGERGGSFRDVTRAVRLLPFSVIARSLLESPSRTVGMVAFADLDGDTWEDIVLGPGLVFKNNQGKSFTRIRDTNLHQLPTVAEFYTRSNIAIADYNKDGHLDLYISRAFSGPSQGSWVRGGKVPPGFHNMLLKNLGDFTFEDVTESSQTKGGSRSVFSSAWMDADNDSWPDLYVTHEFGNGLLLRNRGDGTFEERSIVAPQNGDFGSMGMTCGDFNNDGKPDLYISQMYSSAGTRIMSNLRPDSFPPDVMRDLFNMIEGNELYINEGDLEFSPRGVDYDVAAVGWGYGPATVDLDNDGWLDIYTTCGFISRSRAKPDG